MSELHLVPKTFIQVAELTFEPNKVDLSKICNRANELGLMGLQIVSTTVAITEDKDGVKLKYQYWADETV